MSRSTTSTLLHWLLILAGGIAFVAFFVERHASKQEAEQFRLSVSGADAGQWYWDLDRETIKWDDHMFEILGLSPPDPAVWHSVAGGWERDTKTHAPGQFVYKDDRDEAIAMTQKAIDTRGSVQLVFRVMGNDGKLRTVRTGGRVYAAGRYMTGLCWKLLDKNDRVPMLSDPKVP